MKIHHASKKVLAAALSAAMVVAFAPPSALGLTSGGTVTVEFSAGEGTGSLDSYTYTASSVDNDAASIYLNGYKGDLTGAFTNGKYDFAGYFYDKDGDNTWDLGEDKIAKSDFNKKFEGFKDVEDGSTVKLVAYYNSIGLDSATETSAGADTYTLKFVCSVSGAKLKYKIDSGGDVEYDSETSITGVSATSQVTVTATVDDQTVGEQVFMGYNYAYGGASWIGSFDNYVETILEEKIEGSETTTYGDIDAVVNAKNDGDNAFKTKAFATKDQWNKLDDECVIAVHKSVVAYAKTQLEALRKLKTSDNGNTYSKLSDSNYAYCIRRLDAINTDNTYSGDVFVNDVNSMVKQASYLTMLSTYDASDVEAANPVITSLQNAKNATEAKAAIEKYNKLTSVQKEIVSTADVVAAYEIIADAADSDAAAVAAARSAAAAASEAAAKANKEAAAAKEEAAAAKKETEQKAAEVEQANKNVEQAQAEVTAAKKEAEQANQKTAAAELKAANAQDKAAALALAGKTVTAKAKAGKKAQGKKFSYKLAASESGATAIYAKVSGSKYIKVSANGKVSFAKVKVDKKAKTYKAKVSVTFGTQTVTRTIKYVVKKK